MKKFLSIILSVIMVFSVGLASTSVAMAKTYSSQETKKPGYSTIKVEVNGKPSTDVTYDVDKSNSNKVSFKYNGDGELLGWEFPNMTEGKDYTIISEEGNTITILVSEDYEGIVTANAIVKQAGSNNTKPNQNSKSPKTGAVTATGLGLTGAGAALLLALKKKDEDAE